jgi:lipid-A-disaccharide synthase-like uncharacterized protein
MAVIWGLDLKEMQWGKFKSGYMWNTMYHNRRTKFIIYQLAMILCVVSESLGTAALSGTISLFNTILILVAMDSACDHPRVVTIANAQTDYVDQQKVVSNLDPNVTVHNNNFVGIASYNIFVGIFVATIFGAAFFFDLFWPERAESRGVKIAWKLCSILACLLTLSDALAYTYIVASKSAQVSGTNDENAQRLLSQFRKASETPLQYSKNGRAVASIVFLWPGTIFTFVRYDTPVSSIPSLLLTYNSSTYLLWHSLAHIDTYGPMSTHAREKTVDRDSVASANLDGAAPVTQPPLTHSRPADTAV